MGHEGHGRNGFLHTRSGDQEGPLRGQYNKLPVPGSFHANSDPGLPTAVIVYAIAIVLAGLLSLGATIHFLYCWFRYVDDSTPLVDSIIEPVETHHPSLDVVAHAGTSDVPERIPNRR